MSNKENAADYFARHKASNECFITSDGRIFHTKGAADGFAVTLPDNAVETFKRGVADKVENQPSGDENTGDDTLKNEAIEALKDFDATTATYPEIKALVKALGLESESQKQPDLVAALEAHKVVINTEVIE